MINIVTGKCTFLAVFILRAVFDTVGHYSLGDRQRDQVEISETKEGSCLESLCTHVCLDKEFKGHICPSHPS